MNEKYKSHIIKMNDGIEKLTEEPRNIAGKTKDE
jgi:hypothetical protein